MTQSGFSPQGMAALAPDGWSVRALPVDSDDTTEIDWMADYATQLRANLVITDLCHRDTLACPDKLIEYHRRLRECAELKVLSIEDCRMPVYTSSIAVVPYVCRENPVPRAEGNCEVLSGLDFCILSPRLVSASRQPRQIATCARRILVCIGGGDPFGLTGRILPELVSMPRLEIHVVLGAGFDDDTLRSLRVIAAQGEATTHVLVALDDLSQELLWADVAIFGEGLTKFEAAVAGTPGILISQYDHHADLLHDFLAAGSAHYAGAVDELVLGQIGDEVTSLLDDRSRRVQQSKAGKNLIDGRGGDRVAERVLALSSQ